MHLIEKFLSGITMSAFEISLTEQTAEGWNFNKRQYIKQKFNKTENYINHKAKRRWGIIHAKEILTMSVYRYIKIWFVLDW